MKPYRYMQCLAGGWLLALGVAATVLRVPCPPLMVVAFGGWLLVEGLRL